MSDSNEDSAPELMAIPRLAADIGVTPRVLRYWEEQGLVAPSREHGKLRFTPRDRAIAAHVKRLIDAGVGIDGIRMLKARSERPVRDAAAAGDPTRLVEEALAILYERKAFAEATVTDEEHFPERRPEPAHPPSDRPPPPGPPRRPPGPR